VIVLLGALLVLVAVHEQAHATCERYPRCLQTLYVRSCGLDNAAECDDAHDGASPRTAWRSLQHAADYVNGPFGNAGLCVLVGPGEYPEGDVDLQRSGSFSARGTSLPIQFIGDASGTCTGDAAGSVIVQPALDSDGPADTGFLIFGASDVVVSGFEIVGANVAGIQVVPDPFGRTSQRAVIANNVIHDNGDCPGDPSTCQGRGVEIIDSSETLVFNNLIYRNIGVGVAVHPSNAADPAASRDVRVINNTIYGHSVGINVGRGTQAAARGTWVINNIVAASGRYGIDVNASSTCDYVGAFNLVTGADSGGVPLRYSPSSPRDPSDIDADPRFNRFALDDFSLTAASAAVDAGSVDASVLGLDAATVRADGNRDGGRVDLGFHRGSLGFPVLDAIPIEQQTLYVRSAGDDGNDASTPELAVRSIPRALRLARAVARIVVGPGFYDGPVVFNTTVPGPAGPVEFHADASGARVGDPPGRVVVDGHRLDDTFNIVGRCSTAIDGFSVTGGKDNGIGIKSAHGSVVRNNIAFSNARRGINIVNSDDVQVVNNLAYANEGGVQVGGESGSRRVLIESNTIYGNASNGLLIGTGGVPSPGARVFYNVVAHNGQRGVQLDNNANAGISAAGFCAGYNVVFHPDATRRYGPIQNPQCAACLTPSDGGGSCPLPMCLPRGAPCPDPPGSCIQPCSLAPPSDRTLDPLLARPAGRDGCIGGRRFHDDDFRLRPESPAIDFSDVDPASAGMATRSARMDEQLDDDGILDAGFHYWPGTFADTPPLAADCNGDGCVRIDELVRAVRIALDDSPLHSCPLADLDGDDHVAVAELVMAVNDAYCCTQPAPQAVR
jgi:parallel beta-helix repeat protein